MTGGVSLFPKVWLWGDAEWKCGAVFGGFLVRSSPFMLLLFFLLTPCPCMLSLSVSVNIVKYLKSLWKKTERHPYFVLHINVSRIFWGGHCDHTNPCSGVDTYLEAHRPARAGGLQCSQGEKGLIAVLLAWIGFFPVLICLISISSLSFAQLLIL